jgi:hypothetical protein
LVSTTKRFCTLFKEYVLLLDLEKISQDGWYVNSGATCHMIGECDLFQPPGSMATTCLVRCGIHTEGEDGRREGSVVFNLQFGWTVSFHHVLYFHCLRLHVFSVSTLED